VRQDKEEITMTVQDETRAAELREKDVPGAMAGKFPGVPETPEPGPGELQQTPQEIEGPYYRLGAPQRSNLLEPGDKPEIVLSGRVLNQRGTPIPGAVVSFWSSDAVGNYDMVGYRYNGWVMTDEDGRYGVTTIIPGCYEPREAKHIHVKVQGNSSPITTQLYIEGEPGNTDDDFYHPALVVPCTLDADGVKHGRFDFVIKQVTEEENVTPESLAARV
jgi:protocatechuate 3,4-dioxygenase beta subunit